MSEKTRSGLKKLAIVGSVLVYLAFVVYSEYHFWNLVSSFVPPDFQVLGVIAVAASALSAVILPVALHFWCREGIQRIVAWVFTIIHLVIVFANLILDSATVSGASVSDEFTAVYAVYVLPGTVAVYALGWLLVWATDSDVQRAEQAREAQEAEEDGRWALRKIVAQEKTRALTSAFQSDHAKRKIDRYAGRVAPRILAEELGLSPEELGIEEDETWDFWDVAKKDTRSPHSTPPAPVNGVNGHTGQMHLDAPRTAQSVTQGQQRSDLPPAGNGRAPGSGRPKAELRQPTPDRPLYLWERQKAEFEAAREQEIEEERRRQEAWRLEDERKERLQKLYDLAHGSAKGALGNDVVQVLINRGLPDEPVRQEVVDDYMNLLTNFDDGVLGCVIMQGDAEQKRAAHDLLKGRDASGTRRPSTPPGERLDLGKW